MYCKSCGNKCNESAITCSSCGMPPNNTNSFCKECGEQTNENALVCVKCKSALSENKHPSSHKKVKIDILKDIKSFSFLKKFTICSVFVSIILLFTPWLGEISPINLVEFKNKFFKIIYVDDIPLTLDLFFYFGYITFIFLVFSIFKIYKSDYAFASSLQFFNIVCLVLVIVSTVFYSVTGKYGDWIEDEASSRKVEKMYQRNDYKSNNYRKPDPESEYKDLIALELEECLDDYGFNEKKMKKDPSRVYKFTPILFIVLFLVNWVLIARLSKRKRLKISD